jgi:hypothetical protein
MTNTKNNDFFTCPKDLFVLPISMTAKLVYAALCCMRDKDVGISYRELSTKIGFHKKTVQKAVRQLLKVGALVVIPRYAESGAQLSNKFFVRAFDDDMKKDTDFAALVRRLNDLVQVVL